jgi:hypothetical protein
VDGYEPQVINVEESARAVVERAGRVFVGSKGSIQVMNGTSLETERTMLVERKFGTEFIFTLSVSGALLLTSHGSGAIVADQCPPGVGRGDGGARSSPPGS